uniref:ecotropic viral integration site 5 protein homolog isoform X2 n=1 Tax=Myxine glutinosa TaxID=7769 RepID=UPI00358F129B
MVERERENAKAARVVGELMSGRLTSTLSWVKQTVTQVATHVAAAGPVGPVGHEPSSSSCPPFEGLHHIHPPPSSLPHLSISGNDQGSGELFEQVKSEEGGSNPLHTSPFPTPPPPVLSPEEEELLERLEEQNRLIEADSRHAPPHHRPSLVSLSSAAPEAATSEEEYWACWGRIVSEWADLGQRRNRNVKVGLSFFCHDNHSSAVPVPSLKYSSICLLCDGEQELVRKGIPHHFRGIVWQLLCDAHNTPEKGRYAELLLQASPCERLIRRDIARTFPSHELFRPPHPGQETLFNIMKAYSLVDREVGYCQGTAFIAGLLLMQMPEEDAFAVLIRLMRDNPYSLRNLYLPGMPALGLALFQLDRLLQVQLPELHAHLVAQGLSTATFASPWFLTLFLASLPLPLATRIFDMFMAEGLDVIFRVSVALLLANQPDLLQLDMERMLQFLQKSVPEQFADDPGRLLTLSDHVTVPARRMKRLQKEYMSLQAKEKHELGEMKQLRAENLSLKQSLEELEKSRHSEEFVIRLERELVEARLGQAEASAALRDMQEKVITLEQRQAAFPEETNLALLRDKLAASRVCEGEAAAALCELRAQLQQLEQHCKRTLCVTRRSIPLPELEQRLLEARFREVESAAALRETKLQLAEFQTRVELTERQLCRVGSELSTCQQEVARLLVENGRLSRQLQEEQRHSATAAIQCKEEVMAVRLREADVLASLADMRQRVAELEIEREEGLIKQQLDSSDTHQLVSELQDQVQRIQGESIQCQVPHELSNFGCDDDNVSSDEEDFDIITKHTCNIDIELNKDLGQDLDFHEDENCYGYQQFGNSVSQGSNLSPDSDHQKDALLQRYSKTTTV